MTSPANVFVVVPPEGKQPTGFASLVNADGSPWGGGGVESVNGQTGEVVLSAGDVGALPETAVAAHVGDADDSDEQSLAASIDAIRDALVAAGLMATGD